MTLSPKQKWRSSENIAIGILAKLGYNVVASHYKIIEEGIEIGEIDFLAEKEGELYAIEVKAGRADITSIRQIYVNSQLINAKPLIIARGYADEAAEKLAQKLNVNLIPFSEYITIETEELDVIIGTAITRSLEHLLDLVFSEIKMPPEYIDIAKTIAETNNIIEAAKKLNLSIKDLTRKLREMKEKNIIPKHVRDYRTIKLLFKIYFYKYKVEALLNELNKLVEELKHQLSSYGGSMP
mgnify:CR=1 FL=1